MARTILNFWEPAVKLETGEGVSLNELPGQSSTGSRHETESGSDELDENTSGGGRDIKGTPDAEGLERSSDSQEPQRSASPRPKEVAVLRDGQNPHTTARGDLTKVENVSEISSCSSNPPSIKSSPSQALVDIASTARSPSAAAAETGIAHDSPEATQATAGKKQTDGSLPQEPSTDQAASDSVRPVAIPLENSRKRSFDGCDMEEEAGMSKRRRANHGEDACGSEDGVAHQQFSGVQQLDAIGHQDCLLQDEGDGTFTAVATQKRGVGRNVPVVVSKKEHGTAPQDPTLKSTSSAAAATTAATEGHKKQANIPDVSLSGYLPNKNPNTEQMLDPIMWHYLVTVLCLYSEKSLSELQQQCAEALRAIIASRRVSHLLELPKQRDVQWVANGLPRGFHTNDQIKALLIQITGREPQVPCAECFEGHGPFVGCVMLPPSSTIAGQLPSRPACANCSYRRINCSQPGEGNSFYGKRTTPMTPNFPSSMAHSIPPASREMWTSELRAWPTAWQQHPYAGAPDFGMRTAQPAHASGMDNMAYYGSNGHYAPKQPHPHPPFQYGHHHHHSLPPQLVVPQQAAGQPSNLQSQTTPVHIQHPMAANWQMLPPSPASSNPSPQAYTHPHLHQQAPQWEAKSPHHPSHAQQPRIPSQQQCHPNVPTPTTFLKPVPTPTRTAAVTQVPKQPAASSSTTRRGQGSGSTVTAPSAPPPRQSHSTASRGQPPSRKSTAARERAVDVAPDNIMEVVQLEEWEKAPGRIQSTTSESLDNIAFSRSYLSAGAGHAEGGVRVCEEASFFARALRPGGTLRFASSGAARRLVSVAMGKLHVQLDGEPIFMLATHGLFKIRPGVGCVVANEACVTAVVHVTSIMLDV
ncbi:hypothetical protein VSDG_07434 [Cytospora chrysosperma]|uniref:Uncharacterized protein n=1 Tax=Cytospora chrysosperma TaxID=252740 RepID=A0A423VI83_CYTCH|nr:hypothetical protein VSDG_07434 [Valsa sordida]